MRVLGFTNEEAKKSRGKKKSATGGDVASAAMQTSDIGNFRESHRTRSVRGS